MTHIYSTLRNILKTTTVCGLLALTTNAKAQNSTFMSPSQNCGVITQNFDLGNGGYTSPSIYRAGADDAAFYYNRSRGFWTEMGEDGVTRALPPVPRKVSIVSVSYNSPASPGSFDVGFVYIVPNPSVDRFKVTLVRLTTSLTPGGLDETVPSTVAESDYIRFVDFSSIAPTFYTDANPLQSGQRGAVCIRLNDVDITTGPNIKYRVQVTYDIATSGSFTAFDDFSLNNAEQIPLPVTFLGVVAKKVETGVSVRWDVAEEVNVVRYEIERSTNGENFTKIGEVGTNKRPVYGFTDANPASGVAYYRIKNVDVDGRSKYSSLVKVNLAKIVGLRAYPLPANNGVTVEHDLLTEKGFLTVSTVDGKNVKTIRANEGTERTYVDLTGLNAGMYLFRFDNGKGDTQTLKVVKQ